ncbi:AfsR/SARP family transcriptional regulator [Actinopolymorpha alba]|uniref:AfsR/SARP family transcriptional regulator n=1 Tax=Actinopolymorpha alba TaxID=533267 RepID=UPI0003626DA0|nr:BTAD domain-containing putative transcriptional regulator [Actinopolymorpha alba]
MHVAVLGPLEVRDDEGRLVEVGGARLRALLVRLALDAGRIVTVQTLVDSLWGETPPAGAVNALQSLVSRLRRVVRDADGDRALIESRSAGYLLAVEPGRVDAYQFEELVVRGRRALAAGELARASAWLAEAERLWRGPALADVTAAVFALASATRLDDLRLAAIEDRLDADLSLHRHLEVVSELRRLAEQHPLRERVQAQLMRALYATGRQSEALATYERVRSALSEELGIDPSPELAAVHLAVLRQDPDLALPAELPVVPPESPVGLPEKGLSSEVARPVAGGWGGLPRTHLRTQLSSFVGREAELRRLGELLDGARLVTVAGPGGAGKTRLATELAARLRPDAGEDVPSHGSAARPARPESPENLWFVELAPLTDPLDVPQAVLSALGVREAALLERAPLGSSPAYRDAMTRLVEALAHRHALLVLDNCEHLVDAAARLTDTLLAACPRLRILATSREPLGVAGEATYPIPPLPWPPEGTPVADATALAYPAIRLFVDRATAVRPDFALTPECVPAVVEICRRLDGMPLAIELAAARVRSLSVGQIADRLDDRFRLLTAGSRTALPRHQTLRAVIEWSWDLLTEPERILARRISVFPGGATLAAAERVCAGDGLPAADVLDVLSALVDKSLLDAVMPGDGGGEVRYRMLETVRAYGAECLAEAGESAALQAAHGAYFLDLAERAEPELRGRDQLDWLAVNRAEYDNLVAAARWAIGTGVADPAVRLCAALMWFWFLQGNRTDSTALARPALELPGESPPAARAILLCSSAAVAFFSGDEADAWRSLAQVLWLVRRPGVVASQPMLGLVRPAIEAFRTREAAAMADLGQLLPQLQPWERGMALLLRSQVAENGGDLEAAYGDLLDARAAFEEAGERWGLGAVLRNLAGVHARNGDHAAAVAAREQSLALVCELGSTDDAPEMLAMIGIDRMRLGDLASARETLEEALAAYERDGQQDADGLWFGLLGLAELSWRTNDFAAARQHLDAAATAIDRVPVVVPQRRAMLLTSHGWLAVSEYDAPAARAALDQALPIALAAKDMPCLAGAIQGMAALALLEGEPPRCAFLLGAATSVRGALDLSNPDVSRLIRAARESLGSPAYDDHYERGAGLSREDAIAAIVPSSSTSTNRSANARGRPR